MAQMPPRPRPSSSKARRASAPASPDGDDDTFSCTTIRWRHYLRPQTTSGPLARSRLIGSPFSCEPGLVCARLGHINPGLGRVAIRPHDANPAGARRSTAASIVEGVDHRAHGLEAAEGRRPQQRVLVDALPALGEAPADLV